MSVCESEVVRESFREKLSLLCAMDLVEFCCKNLILIPSQLSHWEGEVQRNGFVFAGTASKLAEEGTAESVTWEQANVVDLL
ncbi:hypothetical protein COLO4_13676 [Corchorus olitorius]|uniref:Uncharacterized protein n=1 Tax=Corchorus olitorius TaxID=93759 RepID=A0A1R3JVL0_9ROSI|nr:hypothetical protein COLO4_13676 [Corchorus olitorius]